ncbi:MAG: class I SAM-dependent methyltransferase, partial [Acidobacteriota bacterium]|nr:class I SAM-dependent methyltransferase [Acidobacteriota bacterium]
PQVAAHAVDLSPAMLRLLTQRAHAAHPTAAARLSTQAANALTLALPPALPPAETYDLIATHFFLDCFTQSDLDHLCARVAPHLAPGAAWVLSDFRIPPRGPLRLLARVLVRALYLAFRVLTGLRTSRLPDHASALARIGLTRTAVHHSLGGLLTSELWRSPSGPRQLTHSHTTAEDRRSTLPPMLPPQRLHTPAETRDPLPNPEPPGPSLPEPDPGVFHHEPAPPPRPNQPPSNK